MERSAVANPGSLRMSMASMDTLNRWLPYLKSACTDISRVRSLMNPSTASKKFLRSSGDSDLMTA